MSSDFIRKIVEVTIIPISNFHFIIGRGDKGGEGGGGERREERGE